MKSFHIFFLALGLPFLLLTSCEQDLELLPQDSLTPEAFYANPENFPAGLIGIYDALQSTGMYNLMPLLDAVTDNAIGQFVSVSDLVDFGLGQITPNVNNTVIDLYQDPYILIQRANALLENIELEGGIANAERQAIKGEAKALRALAYMRLAYFFGDVPLLMTSQTREELLGVSRTPRNEVIAFVLSELEEAAGLLETTPFAGEAGRLTQQAVLGFWAKALVYEARLGNQSWESALPAIQAAVTTAQDAGAALFTVGDGTDGELNYAALFYENNEDNEEILFAVKSDALDRGGDVFNRFGVQAGTLYMTAMEDLADAYYTVDGLPITDPSSIYHEDQPYENRDPRLAANLIVPGALFSNGGSLDTLTSTSNPVAFTTFFLRKTITLNGDITLNDEGRVDAIVLRFADLLLLLAEAENEVNGPNSAAYEAINQVRARVNMPDLAAGLSKEAFRNEVIHERRVELAFEQQRWFDLITLGIADERINNLNAGFGRTFVPSKQELFPIPQSEIDLIPSLTQNPGY